ncbi:MAG: HDOD domain-containing protein [Burkholderiaceae bacterium]
MTVPAPPSLERRVRSLSTAPLSMGARRPLISAARGLAGFEFHVAESMIGRLRRRDDVVAANACTAGVLGAMRLACAEQLVALAELPAAWLARVQAEKEIAPGMMLVLRPGWALDDAEDLPAVARLLREHGAQVGWRPDGAPWPSGLQPDFLLLTGLKHVADLAPWKGHAPLLLATNLPDVDTLEALLAGGLGLASCDVGMPVCQSPQALPPQAQGLLQLLNDLVQDEDHARVVASIKADAALSVRLLQYLNSAGASPGRVLDSIDQAVMVLGRDALYRWVAQMLLRLGPPRQSTGGLQSLALARARLVELLARARGEANPGSLYLLGLASMLPVLLQCPLSEALKTLRLPREAVLALTGRVGPWAPYLSLAIALEQPRSDEAATLATPWGGLEAVLPLSAQAWQGPAR